jgi:hypothetical protein
MLARWSKLMGTDAEGNAITKEVQVRDEFSFNENLIDLTRQPEHVKDLMDTVIIQAAQKEPVGNVGFAFIKFCAQHDMPNLQREAAEHSVYLNAPYALIGA